MTNYNGQSILSLLQTKIASNVATKFYEEETNFSKNSIELFSEFGKVYIQVVNTKMHHFQHLSSRLPS